MQQVIQLAITVLIIVGMWKMFVKAGQPGWAAIVPFYNAYILAKIAGKPAIWLIIFLIPLVNIIGYIEVAKKFGQGAGFGVGMGLLGFIFIPLLGFGSYQYVGGAAASAQAGAVPPPAPPAPPAK